jgi:hypothetical protein
MTVDAQRGGDGCSAASGGYPPEKLKLNQDARGDFDVE